MQNKASNAILQEPFKFGIRAPFLLRLLFIRKIPLRIYPLYYGTMIKISSQLNKLTPLEKESLLANQIPMSLDNMGKNLKPMARIIAMAILNSRLSILFFMRPLASYLLWHMQPAAGAQLMVGVIERAGIESFLSTIISLRGLNVTAPKAEKGMSQNTTTEIIARGD